MGCQKCILRVQKNFLSEQDFQLKRKRQSFLSFERKKFVFLTKRFQQTSQNSILSVQIFFEEKLCGEPKSGEV